jgi:hypothetical protein
MARAETRDTLEGRCSKPASEGERVRRKFRPHLSYANVMSTLAVFIALGGSSYAAVTISGSNLKHRSVAGTKLKRNTVTGLEVRESRLGRVPRAVLADRLGPTAAQELTVRCPAATVPAAGTCIELAPRGTVPYGSAVLACLDVNQPRASRRRRLPTHGELMAALTQQVVQFSGEELTSDVYPSSTNPGRLDALYLTRREGAVGLTTDDAAGAKSFRCAVDPSNQGDDDA